MFLGGAVFLLMIDPKLGMARDWDLFALVGLPPTLLFARMLAAQERIRKWLYPALVLTAAVLVMPFVAVNASRQPALNQYQALLRLDLPKSRTGLTILYSIYKAAGDSALADSVEQVIVTAIPAARQAPLAHQLAEEGKFEQALILVDSMARVEPYSVETLNLRGLVYLKMGQYSRAVQDLELAGRLGRYDSRPLTSLASAYSALHQFDRMMDALRQAQKRDPDAFHVLSGLAVGFFDLRQFDSAKVYAMRAIQIQPTYETGYFIIGYIAHMAGDKTTAKIYLTRVVDLAPGSTYGKRAAELLAQLP
jgi:tetratricopeptide (TPR) repeat protein